MFFNGYTKQSDRIASESCIDEELPYLQTLPAELGGGQVVVLKNGAFLAALEVELRPYETLTDREMDRQSEALHEALRSLREGVEIQVELVREEVAQLRFDGCENEDPAVKELESTRREHLRENLGTLLENRVVVYLTWDPDRRAPGGLGWIANLLWPRTRLRDFRQLEEQGFLEEFEGYVAELTTALAGAGLKTTRLSDQEVVGCLISALNPGVHPPPAEVQPYQYLSDAVSYGEVVLGRRYLEFGGKYVRVLTVKTLPDEIHAYQLRPLSRMPFPVRMVLGTSLVDQEKALEYHQGRYRRAYAMIRGHRLGQGEAARDIGAERKASDHERVVQAMMQGWQLLPTSLQVVVWADDERTLDERELAVRTAWTQELRGSRPLTESVAAWEVFRGGLPGNQGALGRTHHLLSPKVAALTTGLFAGRSSKGRTGRLTYRDREGALVPFTLFDQGQQVTGRVMVVFAETGAGKSFSCVQLLLAELTRDPLIRALDVGGSYRTLFELFGGTILSYSLDERDRTDHINPLNIKELDSASMQFVLGFLGSPLFTKRKEEGLDRAVEGIVGEVLIKLFGERHEGQELVLSDLQRALLPHPDPRVQDLGKRLSVATTGPYGRLMNRPTGWRVFDAKMVYHDFQNCSQDERLTDGLMLAAGHDVLQMAHHADRSRPKVFLMDEAWRLMRGSSGTMASGSSAGAALMEQLARTGRKLFLSPIFISQAVQDFAHGTLREGLLEQAAYQLILQARKSRMEDLAELFRLNVAECALVDSLRTVVGEYSEAFLISPHGRQVVRLQVSPLHYWIASTDVPDIRARELAFDRFDGDRWKALRALAGSYPRGLRAAGMAERADAAVRAMGSPEAEEVLA